MNAMRHARRSALRVALLCCTLAVTAQAFAQAATAPTWDRQVGLLIVEGQDNFIAQLSIELEVPKSCSLVGEPTTQLPVPPPGQSRPWIRSAVLPNGRTLVSLDATFSPPIQIPAFPLILTLRMPHPDELDGVVELNRLGAFRPSGELIPPDDLGWDLVYQSSPDGVYEPLR
jgi:hypothetical protein